MGEIFLFSAPVVRLEPLEVIAKTLAANSQAGDDVAKFAVGLFCSIAFAAVNSFLPAGLARHLYCAVSGYLLYGFVFGAGYLQFLVTAIGCYLVLAGSRSFPVLDRWRHIVCSSLAFGLLTARHVVRSGTTASTVDDSILFMILTVKIYMLGYQLHDGQHDASRLAALVSDPDASEASKATARDRLSRAITELPGVIEYLGFVLNPATLLAGPALDIRTYLETQRRTSLPSDAPSRWPRVAVCLLSGVFCMALHVVVGPMVPVEGMYEQATATGSKQPPLWYRMIYWHISLVMIRVQYYGVWLIAEAAAVTSGFGYRPDGAAGAGKKLPPTSRLEAAAGPLPSPVVGKHAHVPSIPKSAQSPDWLGAANVFPLHVELASTTSALLKYWNCGVQTWLEVFIFKRVPRSINRWVTFAASGSFVTPRMCWAPSHARNPLLTVQTLSFLYRYPTQRSGTARIRATTSASSPRRCTRRRGARSSPPSLRWLPQKSPAGSCSACTSAWASS